MIHTMRKKETKQMVWANFTIIVKKPIFGVTISLPLLSNQKDYLFHIKLRCILRMMTKMRILKQKWRLPLKRSSNH